MTTKRVLDAIIRDGLGEAYQEEIRRRYQIDTEEGLFEQVERDYTIGIAELTAAFSPEEMDQLAAYEEICSGTRDYTSEYGFLAGVYCGFKQFFTTNCETDGGFAKYVCAEIFRMPKMKRHKEYYFNLDHQRNLEEALEAGATEKTQYHIISVECAWAQRAYSAAIDGFYLGYHAAAAILEETEPNKLTMPNMKQNILRMEQQLGYVDPNEAP